MSKINLKRIKRNGVTFFFKYDETSPEQLHIFVRHLTTVGQALFIWFEGKTVFNSEYNRFETETDTHGLYWNWINEDEKKVIIISCFERR